MKCRNSRRAEHHRTTSRFRIKKQEKSPAFITRSVSLFRAGAASCKRWIMRTQGTRAGNCGGAKLRSTAREWRRRQFSEVRIRRSSRVTLHLQATRTEAAPGWRFERHFKVFPSAFFCAMAAEQRVGAVRGAEI